MAWALGLRAVKTVEQDQASVPIESDEVGGESLVIQKSLLAPGSSMDKGPVHDEVVLVDSVPNTAMGSTRLVAVDGCVKLAQKVSVVTA